MKVLISGAGIGGTTAALALMQHGFKVELFEQAPAIRPLGAGISLWCNAIACLARLGLRQPIVDSGTIIETGELRNRRGAVLGRLSFEEFSRRFGQPSVCIQRGRLQEILVGALPPGVLRLGHELTDWSHDTDGVAVRFANGHEARGDVLVGADGLRSLVREGLVGDGPPRYAGYSGWLGLTRFRHELLPPGVAVETWGRGARFGMLHCGAGDMYWFAARNAATPTAGVRAGRKADVLALVEGWHTPIPALVEATDESRIVELPFWDREPVGRWGEGRVTLLGDAAHPMTPNIGQGACQAIEDALTLAECLATGSDPATGLREYERRRIPRTSQLVRQSRRLGRMVQAESRIGAGLRDLLTRLIPPRVHFRQIAAQFGR